MIVRKKNFNFSQAIPVGNKAGYDALKAACDKMGLACRQKSRGYSEAWVHYEGPLDLYFLGANVTAEANGLFRGPLTR